MRPALHFGERDDGEGRLVEVGSKASIAGVWGNIKGQNCSGR